MEDTKNHMSRYSANYHHHHHHHQTTTPSSHRHKHPSHVTSYNQQVTDDYSDDDSDDDGEENQQNLLADDGEEEEEEEEEFDYEEKYTKKRKRYEFTTTTPPPPPVAAEQPQWTDHTTSILLDVWGDKILQLGRKSLRAEEWMDVAKKVSQLTRMVKTDAQCRIRLDTLKKKYKKEKIKEGNGGGYVSKWGHFKKMDMLLLSSSSKRCEGLSCGLDSGEYVFMDSNVYLNCSNGMDEMRDSPENSEGSDGEKGNGDEASSSSSTSFRLLADSIQKFGEIYQKIEESKRQQVQELEKMRMEFHRDLELQKRQMLEQAQAEIEKLQQSNGDDDDEDGDASAENPSE